MPVVAVSFLSNFSQTLLFGQASTSHDLLDALICCRYPMPDARSEQYLYKRTDHPARLANDATAQPPPSTSPRPNQQQGICNAKKGLITSDPLARRSHVPHCSRAGRRCLGCGCLRRVW
jgi:hypothetical protein